MTTLVRTDARSDAWTGKAEAHFATYGPPPTTAPASGSPHLPDPLSAPKPAPPSVDALAKALALVNDNSATANLREQANAYGVLDAYIFSGAASGPAGGVVLKNMENSGIYKKIWAAEARVSDAQMSLRGEMISRIDNGEAISSDEYFLKALNKVSVSDQAFVFAANGNGSALAKGIVFDDSKAAGTVVRYNSLEEYKAALKSSAEEAAPINQRITEAMRATRAEGIDQDKNSARFTLAWINKLSVDDQKYVYHRDDNGMHGVGGGRNGEEIDIVFDSSVDEYKARLKREADHLDYIMSHLPGAKGSNSQTSDAATAAGGQKPASSSRPSWKPDLKFGRAEDVSASIALQVLQGATKAQEKAESERRTHLHATSPGNDPGPDSVGASSPVGARVALSV